MSLRLNGETTLTAFFIHVQRNRLFKAIQQYDHTSQTIVTLFDIIFGPIVCASTRDEMYETVRAIGAYTNDADLSTLATYRGECRTGNTVM
jgi:hypothetical protein